MPKLSVLMARMDLASFNTETPKIVAARSAATIFGLQLKALL
jgi:hypothetical protein